MTLEGTIEAMDKPSMFGAYSLLKAANYDRMSRQTAGLIEVEVSSKPELLLCASAGSSPTGAYERLALRHRQERNSFRELRVLQIDEWGGLGLTNPATCRSYLDTYLLHPLGIGADRFTGFRSDAANPQRECKRIAGWLKKNGPIDICLLGLGLNGHIAMIEPADEFLPHAHVSQLSRRSLSHGMLQNLPSKPRYGLTLGMADILQSRKILLVVSGQTKRRVLQRLLAQRISTQFPASFLWLHSDLTILCDREAYG